MRISSVVARNVGGLLDCDVYLPDEQLIALAGANGTGKSKLLSCILAPWTRQLPEPGVKSEEVKVDLGIVLSDDELDVLTDFDAANSWRQGVVPAEFTVSMQRSPFSGPGVGLIAEPLCYAFTEGIVNGEVLKRAPSLNLIHLPAERRLLPAGQTFVDLNQLTEDQGLAKVAEARAASYNYGRLDDQEFEGYARALCYAGALPDDSAGAEARDAGSLWEQFLQAVNAVLAPKFLIPLTRQNPTELRIGLPDGGSHLVPELSSGERQALIIISRVFRAGEGHSLITIDEPDAYLHPSLSAKLLQGLTVGLGVLGRMIVATHSPTILDSIPTSAIVRLSHSEGARFIEDERDRLALYREAGFRASALTQAELLVVTEGDFDAVLLPQLSNTLQSTGMRSAGGRAQVIRTIDNLSPFELPIIGVVDRDVFAEEVPAKVSGLCHVWPAADLEGVLLSSPEFLQAAIEGKLVRTGVRELESLKTLLRALLVGRKHEAIAEIAQRLLRTKTNIAWPSPRGVDAVDRLRVVADALPRLSEDEIDAAVAEAETKWDAALPEPWSVVRGKWILDDFTRAATDFKHGEDFLTAVVARRPAVASVVGLEELAKRALGVVATTESAEPAALPTVS